MTIRPLAESDVQACAALIAALPLWTTYGLSPETARRSLTGALGRAADAVRVADDGGRILGFVEYSLRGTFHHSGYVRAVAVAEEAQGRGVGTRLMDAAEAAIFRAGPNVFLLCASANTRAQRFYERRGYTRIGTIPDYVRAGLDEILYRKTLGPIEPGGGTS